MAFSDLQRAADNAILTALNEPTVTLHFADNSPTLTIQTLTKNPILQEDYVPGSQAGVTILLLFVRSESATNSIRQVTKGDTATYGGVDYDIAQVDADREGGLTLRCRRRNQRFDQ